MSIRTINLQQYFKLKVFLCTVTAYNNVITIIKNTILLQGSVFFKCY